MEMEDCDGFEADAAEPSFCKKCGGWAEDHLWQDNARLIDKYLETIGDLGKKLGEANLRIAELTRERDEFKEVYQGAIEHSDAIEKDYRLREKALRDALEVIAEGRGNLGGNPGFTASAALVAAPGAKPIDRVAHLRNLPQGWNGPDSPAVSEAALKTSYLFRKPFLGMYAA